jgi:nucleoside-diphosphate-sugar epimerase
MKRKIVITGAAGLVGQNLVYRLQEQGAGSLVCIDKNEHNLSILKRLNPSIETICADLSVSGTWEDSFPGADCLVLLQAQISGKTDDIFKRNTLTSTELVLKAAKRAGVPYIVHVSSSVVNSMAKDDYVFSKTEQERMVIDSGIDHCVLRPTLMFGWFDPKHLGWLSRFMKWTPIFPIPGDGKFIRQPFYVQDFCRIILACIQNKPKNKVYDITGQQQVYYVDIIKKIKEAKHLKTLIVHIPARFFSFLLRVYALFSSNPPFTSDQLDSLKIGDIFYGVDIKNEFGVTATPLDAALKETFCHKPYCDVTLKRTS